MSPRNSRQSTSSSSLTSSNSISNPNIFSDDFALEPNDIPETSPFDADDDPTPTSTHPSAHNAARISGPISPDPTTSTSVRSPPVSHSSVGNRDVVSPTPTRSASQASNTVSDVHRAPSTSSHFSMPRAQSPYAGATGPSHPYGMYPQVTRTSSIASASTVRPIERLTLAPSGPEHPYAMYSQNTVPEEDDISLAQATIPVGFPGMGQQYQGVPQARRDDIADIVGSDGHIEELPPYTQYADEVAPKATLPNVRAASVPPDTPREVVVSPQPLTTRYPGNDVELNATASRSTDSDSSGSFKEKVKRKSKQKVCCGLPFWFLLVIIGVLILGVTIGAAIGGVVASKEGAESHVSADAYQSTSIPTATVTSTAFVDGTPLPTDHPIANVPNGVFNLPTDNMVENSHSCIQNASLFDAWACMAPLGIGVDIFGQGRKAKLTLDAYPLNASFLYGAQPPNLERDKLPLIPSVDLDSSHLGDSLFAWAEYDKLTILHEGELGSDRMYKRGNGRDHSRPGDRPWFCWFNETVIEFFIYVNISREPSTTTTTTGYDSSPSFLSFSPPLSMTTATSFSTSAPSEAPPAMPTKKSFFEDGPPPMPWPSLFNDKKRRNEAGEESAERQNDYHDYPLLVKIKEKRKPNGNFQPYCEQMQILEDGQIGSLPVDRIMIPEEGSDDFSAGQLIKKRYKDDYDPNQDCACEWMTGENA